MGSCPFSGFDHTPHPHEVKPIPKGYGMVIRSPAGREMRLIKQWETDTYTDRVYRKQARAIKFWMRQERGL